ncbi:hypothetical protein ACE38W_04310 [Chitinophaga sp. Hz27]|uniref:hypothetical protein n=1 Tax=Chitinophaga sp. Hz27 TaxID=3347169 RepID=UPI0035DF107D
MKYLLTVLAIATSLPSFAQKTSAGKPSASKAKVVTAHPGKVITLNDESNRRCWFTTKYAKIDDEYVTTYQLYYNQNLTVPLYTVRAIHNPSTMTVKIESFDGNGVGPFNFIRDEDYTYDRYTIRPFGRGGGHKLFYAEPTPWQFLVFFNSTEYTYVDVMSTSIFNPQTNIWRFLVLKDKEGYASLAKAKKTEGALPPPITAPTTTETNE